MKFYVLFLTLFLSLTAFSQDPGPQYYRNLVLKIKKSASFKLVVPPVFPGEQALIKYDFEFGDPVYENTSIFDSTLGLSQGKFFRDFTDKILFAPGSTLKVGNEELPLTCVHVEGLDNRFSGKPSPLFPQFLLKVYLVANDFTCTGPINPGYPGNGGRREHWDTYLYYEIWDPSTMFPKEGKLRYKFEEFEATLHN